MQLYDYRLEPLLYKFVRSCLNRAYAQTDDTSLSAEERYALEAMLSRIRESEDSWKSLDDLLNFLKTEFIAIFEDSLKRLPRDLVKQLFLKTIDLCLELDEVQSNPQVKQVFQGVREKILKIAESTS